MKTAIVIGVGPERGLGGQLCLRFAREGLHVLVAGRTRGSLDALVERIRSEAKSAGLDPKGLDVGQLRVVFEKLMPGELETRGVSDNAAICRTVMNEVASSPLPAEADSASDLDGVFRRLGGD